MELRNIDFFFNVGNSNSRKFFSTRKWERRAGSRGGEIFALSRVGDDQDLSLAVDCGKAGEGVSKSFFGRINDRYDTGNEGAVLPPQLLSFSHPQQK